MYLLGFLVVLMGMSTFVSGLGFVHLQLYVYTLQQIG